MYHVLIGLEMHLSFENTIFIKNVSRNVPGIIFLEHFGSV